MQLDPQAFNEHLQNIGQDFEWRKAYVCPCVTATNQARIDCPQCRGKGYIWTAAVPGTAGVPSQSVQQRYSRMGQWQDGDMVITIPSNSPLYGMGQKDRVTMLNGDDPFSVNLRRGTNDVLPWTVKTFERVFWIVDDAIVEGSLPAQQADGSLVFGSGGPPSGTNYSISGRKRSEYFLYQNFPGDRAHHHGAALPLRVQLRRFDLFGR